jgi:ubiquinone/menaquinone biosynthesis C-methylase UbiE
MYSIQELSFADTQRILHFKKNEVFGTKFNLKGFNYPWILQSRKWSASDHVLDVGAGYSRLPMHIADTYGCEVWSADDFGIGSDEAFWERHSDPYEHIASNPQVKFTLERLGDPSNSTLPEDYFDCIYSASALEHVPEEEIEHVWAHMDHLLRPGGEMIHGLDLRIPMARGLLSVIKATLIDKLYPLMPRSWKLKFAYYTPRSYVRLAFQTIGGVTRRAISEISVLKMTLEPGVLLEPIDWAYNRLVKDGLDDIPAQRVASLLIHIRKDNKEADQS